MFQKKKFANVGFGLSEFGVRCAESILREPK